MSSVAILIDEEYRKEEDEVRDYLIKEFQKNGINVVRNIEESKNTILVYNVEKGITPSFRETSKKLIELNKKPIILIINAQKKDVDYVEVDENISNTWGNINSALYIHSAMKFYYENDTHIAYQVKTGNEKGIEELVDTINELEPMTFFEKKIS